MSVAETEPKRPNSISELHVARRTWQMPPVKKGQAVLWFNGRSSSAPSSPGFVVKVFPETKRISVYVPTETIAIKDSCRHIGDPLLLNPNQPVDDGCWQYNPHDEEVMDAIRKLGEEIADLRSRLTTLTTKSTRRTRGAVSDAGQAPVS